MAKNRAATTLRPGMFFGGTPTSHVRLEIKDYAQKFLKLVGEATDDTLRVAAQIIADNMRVRLTPHNKTMKTASGINAEQKPVKGGDGVVSQVRMDYPAFQEAFGHQTRLTNKRVGGFGGRKANWVKPIGGDPVGGFIYSGVEDSCPQVVALFERNMPGERGGTHEVSD